MAKKDTVGFQKMLAWLATEVMFGRAHYGIVRGLGRRDRTAVLRTAPRFFDMTLGAHADAAQLTVSRIFDRTGAVSIHKLVSSALREAGTFKYGAVSDVHRAVQESKASIAALEPTLVAIRTRRNQTVAHLDARPFNDPAGYVSAGRVSHRQFDELFTQTGAILNKFSQLYRGAPLPLALEDANDFEQVLDLIAAVTVRRLSVSIPQIP